MTLRADWVDRIFTRLSGSYGQQFTGKFSKIENGQDIGVALAKMAWAEELSGFDGNGEAIAYALKNLPSTHCPNAVEFKELCRKAPRPELQALPHKLSAEEKAHQEEQAKKFAEAAKKIGNHDFHAWAKRPGSQLAFTEVLKLAQVDIVFRQYVMDLERQGHSSGKKLINRWDGTEWVRCQ